MELTVLERLTLLAILPPEGNLRTMRVVHELRQELALTQEEIKEFGVREEGQQIVWDEAKAKAVEIKAGGIRTEIITKALRELNEKEKLTPQHLTLCEKFPFDPKD